MRVAYPDVPTSGVRPEAAPHAYPHLEMSRTRRALSTAGLSGAAAALAAAGGATWYYARRITEPPVDAKPLPVPAEDRVHVLGAATEARTLDLRGVDAHRRGRWGVSWGDGYAQVGRVLHRDGEVATRELLSSWGTPPGADTEALFEAYAYPERPDALDLPVEEVSFSSPVGDVPAWLYPAEGPTWAIFVHGRSAAKHEALRAVPTAHARGMPCLTISYRNDREAPRSPDGHSHLGATEWEDVEAAVVYALSRGARDLVLVGYSMGGSLVVNFLRVSPKVDRVRGVVLEAPVLDWGPVLRRAAEARGLPHAVLPVLLPATMAVARMHTGIDFRAMRHLDASNDLRHRTLLIHGDADEIVPVELADSLAAARPDLITYLRVPGAGHVRSWNVDPEAYEAALGTYLDDVLTGPMPRRRRHPRRT